ncbi:MAG TPA: PUA domain-containing protein, partial [Acidimicrobiales bacterium]|nr:PUA domain-containing protein [Acidimicrobiales bacterium]
VGRGTSLLPAGVNTVEGDFEIGDVVEVLGPQGSVVAKGVVRHSSKQLVELAGRKSSDLSDDISRETIHRDDMVILE